MRDARIMEKMNLKTKLVRELASTRLAIWQLARSKVWKISKQNAQQLARNCCQLTRNKISQTIKTMSVINMISHSLATKWLEVSW